jgi:leader peptidase (prepilin peptidase) / N-methyltransferase
MAAFNVFFITVLGLVVGSFLSALTFRWPIGEKVSRGRSFCPKCKRKIEWYDNIPLLSFHNNLGQMQEMQ